MAKAADALYTSAATYISKPQSTARLAWHQNHPDGGRHMRTATVIVIKTAYAVIAIHGRNAFLLAFLLAAAQSAAACSCNRAQLVAQTSCLQKARHSNAFNHITAAHVQNRFAHLYHLQCHFCDATFSSAHSATTIVLPETPTRKARKSMTQNFGCT